MMHMLTDDSAPSRPSRRSAWLTVMALAALEAGGAAPAPAMAASRGASGGELRDRW